MDNMQQQPNFNQSNFNNFQPNNNPGQGMSIAALVCGILGIVGAWIPVVCYFTLVLAILGIVFGAKGMKQAKITGQGKGLAVAGLVLGIIGCSFSAIAVICIAICAGTLAALMI